MKMCRLEEVACDFRGVGCDGRFLREDQENHARENSDKHLTLIASLAVETKDSLIKKLLDQDEKHKELRGKIKEQEQQLTLQQIQLTEQQSKVVQTEEDNLQQRQELQGFKKKFAGFQKCIESLEQSLYAAGLKHSFVMTDFTKEKLKDKPGDWKSPAMYTLAGGYKFCIGVDANGSGVDRGKSISVEMWAMPGKYDDLLKWPAQVKFTIEVINQCGGQNVKSQSLCRWDKPTNIKLGSLFYAIFPHIFILKHLDIHSYLTEDSLHFNISF